MLSVERVGDQIELTVADDGVGMKDKDVGEDSRETRFRLRGDLRAPAWRHDRPVGIGRDGNDRQNTTSLPSGPDQGRRARRCIACFQADRRRLFRA